MSEDKHRVANAVGQDTARAERVAAISRRTVLTGAAATAALSFGGEAIAEAAPPLIDIEVFLRLSAALTGLPHDLLAPTTDSLGMRTIYFNTASQKEATRFAALLQIARDANLQVPTAPPGIIPQANVDALVQTINASGNARYLARSIVLMWYLGAWYGPEDLEKLANDPKAIIDYTVISSKAYTQGWLWRIAQAHPMGYSDMQFGYWTRAPEPLTDFIATRPAKT
jgi:hypothetical protein